MLSAVSAYPPVQAVAPKLTTWAKKNCDRAYFIDATPPATQTDSAAPQRSQPTTVQQSHEAVDGASNEAALRRARHAAGGYAALHAASEPSATRDAAAASRTPAPEAERGAEPPVVSHDAREFRPISRLVRKIFDLGDD